MSIKEIFDRFDKNKDGKLSWDEFADAIRVFTPSMSSEEIDQMFRHVDVDGDGQIDLEEFTSCMKVESGKPDELEVVLKDAFDLFDTDGDGKISAREIQVRLKRLGEKSTLEDCAAMIRPVDVDGDGFVDFEEFKKMMSVDNTKGL